MSYTATSPAFAQRSRLCSNGCFFRSRAEARFVCMVSGQRFRMLRNEIPDDIHIFLFVQKARGHSTQMLLFNSPICCLNIDLLQENVCTPVDGADRALEL
jgi:hypothetical protein